MGGYAFGDSAPAARRLGLLADVFEPPSRAFLERFAGSPAARTWRSTSAAGPGHTTRLVASVAGSATRPSASTSRGRSWPWPRRGTARGDVRRPRRDRGAVPGRRPAGLLYGRFLLSHLPDPAAALAAWATQLAPGGLLLVDEVERIHTTEPALRGYLDTAAALLASRGHSLEIGGRLHRLPDPPGAGPAPDRVARLAPPAARAAELFAQNLAVWRDNAVDAGIADRGRPCPRWPPTWHVVAGGRSAGTITWELRQLAFQRA